MCCLVLYILLNLVNKSRLRTFNVFVVSGMEAGQQRETGGARLPPLPLKPSHPIAATRRYARPTTRTGAAAPGGASAGLQGNQAALGR